MANHDHTTPAALVPRVCGVERAPVRGVPYQTVARGFRAEDNERFPTRIGPGSGQSRRPPGNDRGKRDKQD